MISREALYDARMSVAFQSILALNTPLWLSLCLGAVLLFMIWRQYAMSRLLRQHARSISNMDAWADTADERLDRVDWQGQRMVAMNDARSKWRRAS